MRSLHKFYTFTIALLLCTGIGYAQTSKTFYVCSNTTFTLTPQVTTFTDYEWTEVNNPTSPLAITQNLTQTAPTINNATYTSTKYTLRVKDGSGCWSDPDTFVVYTLPPVSVSVSGADPGYCANNSMNDTLHADVAALTLPAGVTADQYAWTLNNNPIGQNNAQLPIVTGNVVGTSTYAVTVTYSLPGVIGGSKLNSCNGTASVSIIVNTTPSTPSISIF